MTSTDDRCACGKRMHCPEAGETALGNRSGAPFHVTRTVEGGACRLTIQHLDGAPGLPMGCDPGDPDDLALQQMHMIRKGME